MNCPVCGHEMIWTYIGSQPVPCMWKCWACGYEGESS